MLSLDHLKYFRDAAMLGGIGVAAKRNFVTPSAISQAIKSLESYLDVELLEHAKNNFNLTAEGRVLLQKCHTVFASAEALEEEIKTMKGSMRGEVIFATQQSIANHVLPGFLSAIRDAYPEIKITIRLATTDIVHDWVKDRTVDFGVSVDNFGDHELATRPLYTGSYVLVDANNLSKKMDIHRGFVLCGETTRESRTFKSDYRVRFHREPNVLMEINSWGVVKKLAEAGLGVGLIPDYLIRFDQHHALRQVKIDLPKISYTINAYYCPRRQKLPRQCQAFLTSLESYMSRFKV